MPSMEIMLKQWKHLEDFNNLFENIKNYKVKLETFYLSYIEDSRTQLKSQMDSEWMNKFQEYKEYLENEVTITLENMHKEFLDKDKIRYFEVKEDLNKEKDKELKSEIESIVEEKVNKEREILYWEFKNE